MTDRSKVSSKKTIVIKDLKKYFGQTKAVDGISIETFKGEIVGFLGPNGAGKTTAINCMMDFLRPDSGSIKIFGKDSHESSSYLKDKVGFLPGEIKLYDDWTGFEHLDLSAKIRNITIDGGVNIAKELDLDISKKVRTLSSGNKQKLGITLSLAHEPEILIWDEPTNGLDPLLQHKIYDMIYKYANKGHTVFFSSHNLAEVEKVCDRAYIIRQGKIVAEEKISELKKKKLYKVNVFFDKIPQSEQLIAPNVSVDKDLPNGYEITVKGDISTLIKKLAEHKIVDMEIIHSSLEDIFLEFYKNDTTDTKNN